jgi:hypothetical protein
MTCVRRKLDWPGAIYNQLASYSKMGFPSGYGLIESSAFIRKNTVEMRKKMSLWWNQVEKGSIRDQLSFDFIRWRYGLDVAFFPGTFQSNEYFQSYPHKPPSEIGVLPATVLKRVMKIMGKIFRGMRAKQTAEKLKSLIES